MKKILLLCSSIIAIHFMGLAQSTTLTTAGKTGYAGDIWIGPGSTITFAIQNANTHDIILTAMEGFKSTAGPGFPLNPASFKLWFSATSLSGGAGLVDTPVWTRIVADVPNIVNMVPGYNTIFNGINFTVPANTTYRFALESQTGTAYSGISAPSILTADSVSLILGSANDVGYAGSYPNSSYNNSYFTGSITFKSAQLCTSPPNAGITVSSVADTCSGLPFNLSLSGYSGGIDQTFQWQSSPNNAAWTNVGTALAAPSFSASQSSTNYYRCAVQCSGGSIVYSTSVQVITPSYLSGTFTINSAVATGGSNFQSFNDALNAIRCGINGPVVFNVAAGSGPYAERFIIPQITGSSATNTLTINGNGATLLYTSNDASNKTAIILNGADHVVIDSLIIDVSAGNYGYGLVFTNQADSNIIRKCTIIASSSITSQNAVGIIINGSATVFASSGNNANGNSIINNTIIGGLYSIYLYGNSSNNNQNKNNTIAGNIMQDMNSYCIYAIYQPAGLIISGNDISRPTRTNSGSVAGAYIYTGCAGVLVEKNKVHNLFDAMPTSTQASYGFFIGCDPPVGQEIKVINNLVYNMNGNGLLYGIICTFGNNCKMYHNTIVLDDQAATAGVTVGVHNPVQSTGIDFRNNLVYIARTGTGSKTCVSIGSTLSTFNSNNNILYIAPTVVGKIGILQGTNYATLASWQVANGSAYDQASVSADPVFTSIATANYKPTAASVDNIGAALGIIKDLAGTNRSNATPDAGAYEFGTIVPLSIVNYDALPQTSANGEGVKAVLNKWTTANEINVSHFNIQRSLDGREFKSMGKVVAQNNTLNKYNFTDNNLPIFTTNQSSIYYRLQSVDKDGSISYSATKQITINEKQETRNIVLFPNPAKHIVNITGKNIKEITVTDYLGRIVLKQSVNQQSIIQSCILNIQSLPKGVYVLGFANGEKAKLVKE